MHETGTGAGSICFRIPAYAPCPRGGGREGGDVREQVGDLCFEEGKMRALAAEAIGDHEERTKGYLPLWWPFVWAEREE